MYGLISILYLLVFVFGSVLLTRALPHWRRREIRWLVLLTLSIWVISFCSLNVYMRSSLEQMATYSRLRFLGFAFLPLSWFFFLVSTFGGGEKLFLRKTFIALSLLPSLVTAALSLGFWSADALVRDFQIFSWGETPLIRFSGGAWFPVHYGISLLWALGALLYSSWIYPKLEPHRRKQLIALNIGSLFGLSVDVFCVVTDSPVRWAMLSGATYLFVLAAIAYSLVRHGLLDYSPLAKEHIFRGIPDPVLILNEQDRILDFNDSARALFRLNDASLLRSWFSVAPDFPKERDKFEWCLEEEWGNRHFEVNTEHFRPNAMVSGKIVFLRDVTSRKEIERQLSGNIEFKDHLVSIMAHDFSGMLDTQSVISSKLESHVSEELREQMNALSVVTLSAKEFMSNILLWARSQESAFNVKKVPYELNTLVGEMIEEQNPAFLLKGVVVDWTPSETPLILEGDSIMIASAIRNILSNAVRASSSGQSIRVSTGFDGENWAWLKVSDEGVGLCAEKLAELSGGSNQANATGHPDELNRGLGIGLTLVKRIVAWHQATLNFESLPPRGMTVTLQLPCQKKLN